MVWRFLKGQEPSLVFSEPNKVSHTHYATDTACRIYPYLSLCTQLSSNLSRQDDWMPKKKQTHENIMGSMY